MLREAVCRVAEPVWRGWWRHCNHSAKEERWRRGDRIQTNRWITKRQTDGRLQATTDKQRRWIHQLNRRERHREILGRYVLQPQRNSSILTSALSIPATIFIALLAALLHTKSLGLVSASHTSEATIHSSRSPAQTHEHKLPLRCRQPACSASST